MSTKILILFTVSICVVFTGCKFSSSASNILVNTSAPTNVAAEPEGTPMSASAESPAAAAAALVADLYKAHDAKKSPFFQTKNRGLVDKYFTKPLADLIWKDANNSRGEVGAIDGDPLYNAQDVEIKGFAVGKADVRGDAGNVPVTFTNFGQKVTINFAVKKEKGVWKIENIIYGDGDSLQKWLKDTYSENTNPTEQQTGEFEGKYTVGPTFCIVKPVKMAFEIKWAKGSGIETFYFKEGSTFESNDDPNGVNQFVFDDQNYDSGTFYRNDGKSFPVKRAK